MAISRRTAVTPRLLVRPSPLKGEGLRGYLLRVSESNGYGSKGMSLWTTFTGDCSSKYALSDATTDGIATALSLSQEALQFISYRPEGEKPKDICFFGHTISKRYLRRTQPALCPACLNEQHAISGLWDLAAVCSCPSHGNWLINRCPSCGDAFKWGRQSVARCQCGYDLRTAETQAAPPDVLVLTSLIHEMALRDFPTFQERSLDYPAEIRQISLNTLLGLFHYTSCALLTQYGSSQPGLENATQFFRKHTSAAIRLAELLKDWPHSLRSILAAPSDPVSAPALLTSAEFRSRYQRVLLPLQESGTSLFEVPDFFKSALRQFRDDYVIYQFGQGRYLNPSVTWKNSDGQRVLYLHDCLKALGTRKKDRTSTALTTFSDYLRRKADLEKESLTPTQVEQQLGLRGVLPVLEALAELGYLKRWNGWNYQRRDITKVVSWTERLAGASRKFWFSGSDLLPLNEVLRHIPKHHFKHLIMDVARRRIRLYKEDSAPVGTLSGLAVSRAGLRIAGVRLPLRIGGGSI